MIELEKTKYDQIKEIADTSLKISEAKNVLFNLKKDEDKYLKEREEKTLGVVKQVLKDSKDLLDQTKENYEETHQFCQTLNEFADFLIKGHQDFQELLSDFQERSDLWEIEVKKQQEESEKIRQETQVDKNLIANDKENIKIEGKALEQERRKIKIERETLQRAITRLKEGKI